MKTINAQDLLDAYNGKYKYVTESETGCVRLHITKPRQESVSSLWFSVNSLFLNGIAITEFQGKDWTECIYKAKPSEEDWVGCLCRFANCEEDLETPDGSIIDILTRIKSAGCNSRYCIPGSSYECCRPVRRDEIKFFNDDTSEE